MASVSDIGGKCFGCGACRNRCPVGAITMRPNREGFLHPHINDALCVNCGLCRRACPALGNGTVNPDAGSPDCYAAYYRDDVAMASSSGGVFSALAEYVLDAGGVVCGAAFDDAFNVRHAIVSSPRQLSIIRKSKYVQSDTGTVYQEIENLLAKNKTVLFSGTPCQVAGLRGFLGRDYDNLFLCEVFCHGAPSPAVWREYLDEIAAGGGITGVDCRDKIGSTNHAKYNFTINTTAGRVSGAAGSDIYMRGFLRNLYLRGTCGRCPLARIPRCADISLGDFWGYNRRVSRWCDTSRGISAVLVNTPRGRKLFDAVRGKLDFVRRVGLDAIVRGNPCLTRPAVPHANRARFFGAFAAPHDGIVDMIKEKLTIGNVAILNFSSATVNNYGAVLVGYAMEHAVRKLGYVPYTVNRVTARHVFRCTNHDVFHDFRNRFMNMIGICTDKRQLQKHLGKSFDKFIVGSDQVFRWHDDFLFFFDWVYGHKTLIAYAASFGKATPDIKHRLMPYARKCIARFDAISVREDSGADIMANRLGRRDVAVVCDPTMLLGADDYRPITDADNTPIPNGDYIAYYMLDHDVSALGDLVNRFPVVDAYRDDDGNMRTVGGWLNIIKNAKYVVTDSFHGSVFSIIFNKQFIVLQTNGRGNDRIDTLMRTIGCERNVPVGTVLDGTIFDQMGEIDYSEINARLEQARDAGYKWLARGLAIAPNKKRRMTFLSRIWPF